MTLKYQILYSILSGLLLFLSFPPYNFYYFAFFALIPLIIVLQYIESIKNLALITISFSLTFTLGLLYWIYVYNLFSLPGIIILFFIYFFILFLIYNFINQRNNFLGIFLFPFIWTTIEYLRSSGKFGFPWGVLGYSQYSFIQFIQISDIIGVFGISFLICLINSMLAFLYISKLNKNNIIVQSIIVIILLFIVLLYGFDKIDQFKNLNKSRNLRIGILQPNISPYFFSWSENREKIANKLITGLENLAIHNPDLIILSETIILDDIFLFNHLKKIYEWSDFRWHYLLTRFLKNTKTNVFFGFISKKIMPDGLTNYYNSATLLKPNGEIIDVYNKIHLVPFGEFFPYANKYKILSQLAEYFMCGDFSFGNEFKLFNFNNEFNIAPLICYESIFNDLNRQFAKLGADIFINITNDAWTKSNAAHYQHFYMNVFTAVQNKLPVIRCGNSGISGVINNIGEILYQTQPLSEATDIFNFDYFYEFKYSFYTRYGDIFSQIAVIIVGINIFLALFFYKKNIDLF